MTQRNVLVPAEATEEMKERGMSPFLAAHDLMFIKNEPTGPIYKAMLSARPASARLVQEAQNKVIEAARFLTNEVIASDGLFEAIARRELGNTNYTIMIQRAREARAAIAALDRAEKEGG